MPAEPNPYTVRFARLFAGRTDAYGTAEGRWVKQPPKLAQYSQHLRGEGPGLGIAPLLNDGTVRFASIDLDRPDFDMGRELQTILPGPSFIERSRSGNVHIHVFFKDPIPGWVPRGLLREACAAMGDRTIEVFPKQDRLREGMLGNYINLPYFGDTRPVLCQRVAGSTAGCDRHRRGGIGGQMISVCQYPMRLSEFVEEAEMKLNETKRWVDRARLAGIPSPEERENESRHEFGDSPTLHMCAEHIIANRETNPILHGHRDVVYFNLAVQLANWSGVNHDEALEMMELVNDASPDRVDPQDLEQKLFNAERGGYTRTGCDDPVMSPYVHPDCKIARQ